jgi:anion-transporting  ArsA/GET3 family ATPase
MDSQVMTWLIKPFLAVGRFGLGRLLSASERLMGGIAKVTGFSALKSFAEFLLLMQDVLEGFQKTGEKITQLLREARTSFVLVTMPTASAVRSARHLSREVRELGYGIDLLIFNRALPAEVVTSIEGLPPSSPRRYLEARHESEAAMMRDLTEATWPMIKVVLPDQSGDQCDAHAIFKLADRLGQG